MGIGATWSTRGGGDPRHPLPQLRAQHWNASPAVTAHGHMVTPSTRSKTNRPLSCAWRLIRPKLPR